MPGNKSIVGTWRVVATRASDEAGRPMPPPYGPQPMGLVTFTADGRMMAVLCDGRRALPEGETEREYSSYCGNYVFDGTTLTTRVDATGTPGRLGSDQVRNIVFEGDRIVFRPPPRAVKSGRTQLREIVWERIA